MIEWIKDNQAVVNLGVSIATLLVWVIYAQLLYFGFRRQRTPRMLINRGRKKNLDALCIISNMSQEAIYVEYILATLETSRGTVIMDVTDFEQEATEEREDQEGNTRQVSVIPQYPPGASAVGRVHAYRNLQGRGAASGPRSRHSDAWQPSRRRY